MLNKYSKKAAMEMTMGTMVTIVLLTIVLILGGYFANKVFSSASGSIDSIDQSVKNEINKLFSEDTSKRIVVYPSTRKITLQKGQDDSGFGFSIRNVDGSPAAFSYEVFAIENDCSISLLDADSLIAIGKDRSNIKLDAGSIMSDPVFVRFNIPESAPPCLIRYAIEVHQGGLSGTNYGSIDMDVVIKGK